MLKGVKITYNTEQHVRAGSSVHCSPLPQIPWLFSATPQPTGRPFFSHLLLSIPLSLSSAPDTLSELTGTTQHYLCLPEQRKQLSLELGEGQGCYKFGRFVQLTKPCIITEWALGIDLCL